MWCWWHVVYMNDRIHSCEVTDLAPGSFDDDGHWDTSNSLRPWPF